MQLYQAIVEHAGRLACRLADISLTFSRVFGYIVGAAIRRGLYSLMKLSRFRMRNRRELGKALQFTFACNSISRQHRLT